jgi:hypothetical protein
MKTNKYSDLINFGFKPKTLMTLSESDINKLHKNLVESKKKICTKCGMTKCNHKKMETNEKEEKMIKQTTYDPKNAVDRNELASKGYKVDPVTSKVQLNQGKEEDGKGDDMTEKKSNPWAICHAQVGPKKTRKFERCVRQVKQSMKENKMSFDRILENKILSLVEKHLKPKMRKGDLINLVGKKKLNLPIGKLGSIGIKEEEETKTKPKVTPGTKTPPKKKPLDPFKPSPNQQPAPRAKKSETKEAVMDAPAPTKKPTVAPGTKTPPKKKPLDPFKPSPNQQPAPRARVKTKLPSWLKFNNLGIKFKK